MDRALTDNDLDIAAVNSWAWLTAYMKTTAFETLALDALEEIERGGLSTPRELAEALGLPEPFLAVALSKFIADHGGLN